MTSPILSNALAPASPPPPVTLPLLDPIAWGDAGSHLHRQIGVVHEMLSDLDMHTAAGQRYAMSKIVALLEEKVTTARIVGNDRGRFTFAHLIRQLRRESARLLPDAVHFVTQARSAIALIA